MTDVLKRGNHHVKTDAHKELYKDGDGDWGYA